MKNMQYSWYLFIKQEKFNRFILDIYGLGHNVVPPLDKMGVGCLHHEMRFKRCACGKQKAFL
jgi:hypothetical protein